MPEHRCTTCGERLAQCACLPPDPPDTLRRVVERQQAQRDAERARKLAALTPLISYAELDAQLPRELQDDIKALCLNLYAAFFPRTSAGGRLPDLDAATFHQDYWDAYHKCLLAHVRDDKGRPTKAKVAAEMLMSERNWRRRRRQYKLPWPPSSPN